MAMEGTEDMEAMEDMGDMESMESTEGIEAMTIPESSTRKQSTIPTDTIVTAQFTSILTSLLTSLGLTLLSVSLSDELK